MNALGCLFAGTLIVLMMIVMAIATANSEWHSEAIKHKAAHYDTQTGAFTWNQ